MMCYHDGMMERTTISLPRELIVKLRILAAERRTSMASLIREALEESVAVKRPKPKSIGMGASKYKDTAEKAGDMRFEPRPWR
jgi:Arc/MetJ-type ribon-helix-helix transcriptional regulator